MGTEGLLRGAQQLCVHCHERSEEVRGVHYPRHLPYQDPHKTSHEGRCENGFWPGDQGEGEASKDNCEGLPSGRAEETDLVKRIVTVLFERLSSGPLPVGIPRAGLGWCVFVPGQCNLHTVHSLAHCPYV